MKKLWHRKIGQGVIDVAFASHAGVVVAGDVDGTVKGFDYSGNVLFKDSVSLPIWGIDINSAGNKIAIGMATKSPPGGGVVVLTTSHERHEWKCSSAVWDVKFSSDEKSVYASTWSDGLVQLNESCNMQQLWASDVSLFGLSRNANKEFIVTGSSCGIGKLTDKSTAIDWLSTQASEACYKNLQIPGRILFGSSSNILYDFKLDTGEMREFELPLEQLCGIGLFGRYILLGDLKGRLIVADKDVPSLPLHIEKIGGGVWSVAVDEEKEVFFLASGDGSLHCYRMDETAFHSELDFSSSYQLLLGSIAGARVFLSYATEDRDKVKGLYGLFKKAGVKPWMDCYDLLPGQNWKREINRQMQNSDFVVLCLSKQSVRKTGFVQRELREAVEMLLNMPEDNIFILPILLDDCEIPEALKDRHYVALGDSAGIPKLLQAIGVENQRRAAIRSGK
jgi:hypothetical protein